MRPQSAPSPAQLANYAVFDPNSMVATKASLYDRAVYPQAGQNSLTFFQNPLGSSGKTFADTNMTSAGQLPQPQSFLIQGIQISFDSGAVITATGATATGNFTDDTFKFYKLGGWLELFIGSQSYINESPLMKFPPLNGISGHAALSDTTTAGANQRTVINYATAAGSPYMVAPPILLGANMNFRVTLNWPTAQAVSVAGSVMVTLDGLLYKAAQ